LAEEMLTLILDSYFLFYLDLCPSTSQLMSATNIRVRVETRTTCSEVAARLFQFSEAAAQQNKLVIEEELKLRFHSKMMSSKHERRTGSSIILTR